MAKDRELAQKLFEMKDTIALLEKYLVNLKEDLPPDLMNITDDAAGEYIKTDIRANLKIKSRWDRLKRLGLPEGEGESPVAPE